MLDIIQINYANYGSIVSFEFCFLINCLLSSKVLHAEPPFEFIKICCWVFFIFFGLDLYGGVTTIRINELKINCVHISLRVALLFLKKPVRFHA